MHTALILRAVRTYNTVASNYVCIILDEIFEISVSSNLITAAMAHKSQENCIRRPRREEIYSAVTEL